MNTNKLLLSLSAKKSGSLNRYRAAVEEISLLYGATARGAEEIGQAEGSDFPLHLQLKYNFERLGHIEFLRGDFPNGWCVVPPVLISKNMEGKAFGLLCGARTPNLVKKIEKHASFLNAKIEISSQKGCPDRVLLTAERIDHIRDIALSAEIHFTHDAVNKILAVVPPIDDGSYLTACELPFGTDWTVEVFCPKSLRWNTSTPEDAQNLATFGLYKFDLGYGQKRNYLCASGNAYQVDDAQVGKYLTLMNEKNYVVAYDAQNQTLAIPPSCRPPLLIDRALTLSSGLLPAFQDGKLLYCQIPTEVANKVIKKLRQ